MVRGEVITMTDSDELLGWLGIANVSQLSIKSGLSYYTSLRAGGLVCLVDEPWLLELKAAGLVATEDPGLVLRRTVVARFTQAGLDFFEPVIRLRNPWRDNDS